MFGDVVSVVVVLCEHVVCLLRSGHRGVVAGGPDIDGVGVLDGVGVVGLPLSAVVAVDESTVARELLSVRYVTSPPDSAPATLQLSLAVADKRMLASAVRRVIAMRAAAQRAVGSDGDMYL